VVSESFRTKRMAWKKLDFPEPLAPTARHNRDEGTR
jgi:hypothetical protein